MLKRRNAGGDTIVEVLIVLAVLGLAISIAYATANRSLLDARQAQEHAEATQLAQSQVEALRTMTQATGANKIFQVGSYCLTQNAPGSNPPYTRATGATCSGFNSSIYDLAINWDSGSSDTFTVDVTWPAVFGTETDKVTLTYRIHP